MHRWQGKVAIVTGASSGIGAAIALNLAEHGIAVVGLARRSEKIQDLNKNLSSGKQGKIHAVKCDVGNEQDILKALKWIDESLGDAHILVNNAGYGDIGSVVDTSTQIWKDTLNVNVLGVATLTREFLKRANERDIAGHIVSISSTLGLQVSVKSNAYSSSKFALQGLQEVVRQELVQSKSKVKITTICPGATETELLTANLPKLLGANVNLKDIPMLRSEDIAKAVEYVLSTPPDVQIQQIVIRPVLG